MNFSMTRVFVDAQYASMNFCTSILQILIDLFMSGLKEDREAIVLSLSPSLLVDGAANNEVKT